MTAMMVVALLLAACQGNPEPPPLDGTPTSPSPSRTTSPTVAAPSLPPEAEGTSPTAAKAFVRHYVDLVNYAMATGDTGPMQAASAPNCESCAGVEVRIRGVYEAGGSIESNGWQVRSLALVPLQPRNRPMVDAGIEMSPQLVRQNAKAEPERFKGGRLPTTFFLAYNEAGWIVIDWERVG